MEIETPDAEETAMRDLGRQQDALEHRAEASEGATPPPEPSAPPAEEPGTPPPQPKPVEQPQPKPDDSEPEPTPPQQPAAGRQRDEQGRFKSDNGEQAQPPKSRYAQAREQAGKESERFDRSWSKLQADKEAFRAQQQEWEDQQRMSQLRQQSQVAPLKKDGIDINGYHKAYIDFRANAEADHQSALNAMRCLETVLELESVGRQQAQHQQAAQLEYDWRTQQEQAFQANPDLFNPENPLFQEVDAIINDNPWVYYIPNGFHWVYQFATMLLAAGSDSELREQLEQRDALIEELQRGSQPARSGPGKPPQGPKRQEDMTLEEEEAYLRDLTRREDSMMVR